jgi:hypothetical protein
MVLDSYAAPIYWLYPFSDRALELVHVSNHYDFWVWNFVLHWSFLAELFLVGGLFSGGERVQQKGMLEMRLRYKHCHFVFRSMCVTTISQEKQGNSDDVVFPCKT